MTRIGVVVNPRAKYFRHHPGAIAALERILGDRGVLVASDGPEVLSDVARTFHDAQVDVIGVCGGDGTAGKVVDGFRAVYGDAQVPPVALLRGGTMNTVARSLGVPRGTPEAHLTRLLDRTAHGPPPTGAEQATLSVAGHTVFLFGTGVFRGFLEEYYAAGSGDPSPVTAATTISRIAVSAFRGGPLARRVTAPITCTLTVDGQVWPQRDYMGVNAGSVDEVGLGFKPFFLAGRYRDAIHVVTIHGRMQDVVRDLWRIWLGKPLRKVSGESFVARELIIETPDGAVPYMHDGDLSVHEGPLVVTAGAPVRLIV